MLLQLARAAESSRIHDDASRVPRLLRDPLEVRPRARVAEAGFADASTPFCADLSGL